MSISRCRFAVEQRRRSTAGDERPLGSKLPVPGQGQEGLESAPLARCRTTWRGSPNRAHSRHSALATGTALYAPKPPSMFGFDRRGRVENRLFGDLVGAG